MTKQDHNQESSNDTTVMEKVDEAKEQVIAFAQSNKVDTIAFVLLMIGVLVFLVDHRIGGAIVGVISGTYFGERILSSLYAFNSYIEEVGLYKPLMLMGVGLTLFIAAPFVFIGAGAVVGVRALMNLRKAK